jgi:hypothetical protein
MNCARGCDLSPSAWIEACFVESVMCCVVRFFLFISVTLLTCAWVKNAV